MLARAYIDVLLGRFVQLRWLWLRSARGIGIARRCRRWRETATISGCAWPGGRSTYSLGEERRAGRDRPLRGGKALTHLLISVRTPCGLGFSFRLRDQTHGVNTTAAHAVCTYHIAFLAVSAFQSSDGRNAPLGPSRASSPCWMKLTAAESRRTIDRLPPARNCRGCWALGRMRAGSCWRCSRLRLDRGGGLRCPPRPAEIDFLFPSARRNGSGAARERGAAQLAPPPDATVAGPSTQLGRRHKDNARQQHRKRSGMACRCSPNRCLPHARTRGFRSPCSPEGGPRRIRQLLRPAPHSHHPVSGSKLPRQWCSRAESSAASAFG